MNKPLQTVETNNIANQALVTLDPESYAAAIYEPFKARLKTAIDNTVGLTYNIQTKEGMAVAKEHRATLRAIRIEADKERAARKAPITAISKLLESKYTEIEAAVTPHEDKFHNEIKAEEERIEEIKAAKLKAEEEAKAAIQNKIDAIKNKPLEVMNKSVADIEAAISELSPLIPTPAEFGERFIEAEFTLKATIDTLKSILSGKQAQELLEAQNKALQEAQAAQAEAAAQAAKEQSRIDGIKAKIQDIKNFIIEGTECETSTQLSTLIEKLDAVEITEALYSEFVEEALSAASKALQALHRQHAAMFNAEQAEAAARQELEAKNVAEVKPIPEGDGITNDTINQADFNTVFEVKEQPAVVSTTTGKRPTAQAIINLVATTYKVDEATASRWLSQSFGELKAA